MGKITSAYIFPHPPVIIPEVGRGDEKRASETINAVNLAAETIREEKPGTIILTTPHGPVFQDYVYISASERLAGDLGRFGRSDVKLEFENNTRLVEGIIRHAGEEDILAGGMEEELASKYRISRELDHGALVPLYFINKALKGFKLVHIAIAGLPFTDLYRFGMCISRAVEETDEQVVFIASGDLSHRLSSEGPYGYSPEGEKFDRLLIDSIESLDVEKLLSVDEDFCESAGECGLRSFIMMLGAFDGFGLKSSIYSYEGPFGIGYAVARLENTGPDNGRSILARVEAATAENISDIRGGESPYVKLARHALETYVSEGTVVKTPGGLPAEMLDGRAGVFVSLKKQGQLRGCIGTTAPTRENIAREIIYNAISSGTQDPRFNPVEEDELSRLVYSVDVLKDPEPIKSMDELDVIKYGVIVKCKGRSGLLLPNLEGVDTPEKQVSIALQKAGIRPDEDYRMERFEVVRYK